MAALTQAPLGVAIFDREMRYLAASSQYLTDQGCPGDMPLVGRLHYDVFPEVPQRWRDLHARALSHGEELSHEADPLLRPDGRTEWIRWSLAPWRDDAGEIGGVVLYTEIVTARVEARLRLEKAEAQYHAVFDQAAMGVARVAPTGAFLEVNDRFCAITHYTREQLFDLGVRQITHPDDIPADVTNIWAMLRGEIDTYSTEKRYVSQPGEHIWARTTVSLVRSGDGEPAYFIAIIDDITDRKRAEAEQQRYQGQLRLMINELNHRVKNTLATVQSMAAQTLRSEPDPLAAYEKFEARLMGLSQVHDVLTRERWYGADLREVAERALSPFIGVDSARARLEGAPVWLQPGAALTMALVFHELATNAVKYGALSNETGWIELAWSLDTTSNRLTLSWVETGGPAVAPPARKGFGSRLIERGLRGELRGSAVMRYAATGFTCAMEASLPRSADMLSLLDGDPTRDRSSG